MGQEWSLGDLGGGGGGGIGDHPCPRLRMQGGQERWRKEVGRRYMCACACARAPPPHHGGTTGPSDTRDSSEPGGEAAARSGRGAGCQLSAPCGVGSLSGLARLAGGGDGSQGVHRHQKPGCGGEGLSPPKQFPQV